MYVYVDDSLQLGIDCVATLSARRMVVYGWTMTPRVAGTEIAVSAGADGICAIEHCSFHPRPDVVPPDPRAAVVNGFTLVIATPEDPQALRLAVAAGDATAHADLRDPAVETNLFKATADRDWRISFGLLREVGADPSLAELAAYQQRPFGAFADWMGRLPLLRGRAENFAQFAEVECLASPAGEVLAMLRSTTPMPPDAELHATLFGWLADEPGAPPIAVPLPLSDWHATRLPAALAGYGRLDPGLLDRLQGMELVLQAELRTGETIWIRGQPMAATVPELLDAAGRAAPLSAPAPAGAATAGLGLLRQVIARREAAFLPSLAALGAGPVESLRGGRPPRTALILGADDPAAGRLFHVTAAEFERRSDTLLVMGEAAEVVAEAFARRGRLVVLTGAEAALALREVAGRAGILAVDAVGFAEAVAAGRPEDAFGAPLDGAEVARLLTLHALAGCALALPDSLQRLLRLRRAAPAEQRFAPIARAWATRQAPELVTAHLQRLWSAGTAAAPQMPAPVPRFPAEALLHG